MRAVATSIVSTWFLSVTQGCVAGLLDPHHQMPHCSRTGQRPNVSVRRPGSGEADMGFRSKRATASW